MHVFHFFLVHLISLHLKDLEKGFPVNSVIQWSSLEETLLQCGFN